MALARKIPMRPLGSQGAVSSAQGFGCMGLTAFYTTNSVPEEEGIAVIHRALQLGVTHLDTSNIYGPHTNEVLVGKAIKDRRGEVFLATKFGVVWTSTGPGVCGSPEHVRACVEGSLDRLQIQCIDLYYQHRVDRSTPIEETWKELKKLVEEGKVKYLGISEASSEEIRRAHAVHPITACQLEWSLWTRDAEEEVIPTCRELGIAIVAYSPLGRGFLTGAITESKALHADDSRVVRMPRFQGDNFDKNLELVRKVEQIAQRKGVKPGQLALAWVHSQGEDVFPIPGTKRVKYLEENVEAFFVELTPEEKAELEDIFDPSKVHGGRYAPEMAQWSYDGGKKAAQ
eukprot:jgi/Botrbrau1/9170/Bobra.0236s0003.1